MKHPIWTLALALFLGSFHIHAQDSTTAPAKEAPETSNKKPTEKKARHGTHASVWTATKDGKTLHLAGSVHVGDKDMFPLPPAYERAYDSSKILVFETDLKKMSGIFAQMKMLRLAKYADGSSLEDNLDKDTWNSFKERCEDVGVPMVMVRNMKPFMAGTTLSMMELQKLGFTAEKGVDGHLEKRARKDKKKVIGLEDMKFYSELFPSLDDEEQIAMLKMTLKDFDKIGDEMTEMMRHWRTGNAEHLDAMMKEGMAGIESIEKKLLFDRNKDWIPKLLKLQEKHDEIMVVVGAGHLVGEGSVNELLEKEGYTIEQAKNELAAEPAAESAEESK